MSWRGARNAEAVNGDILERRHREVVDLKRILAEADYLDEGTKKSALALYDFCERLSSARSSEETITHDKPSRDDPDPPPRQQPTRRSLASDMQPPKAEFKSAGPSTSAKPSPESKMGSKIVSDDAAKPAEGQAATKHIMMHDHSAYYENVKNDTRRDKLQGFGGSTVFRQRELSTGVLCLIVANVACIIAFILLELLGARASR